MKTFFGAVAEAIEIGGFVVNHIGALDMFDNRFGIPGVCTEGIALALWRLFSYPFVPDNLARRSDKILTIAQVVIKMQWNGILFHAIDDQPAGLFLFPENKSIAFYTMLRRKTFYLDLFIVNQG